MELRLENKDYVADGAGGVVGLTGSEELLARVLFQLTVRRGSFPFLPSLGSRLYLLQGAKPGQWESLARQYVTEALASEPSLTVTDVTVYQQGEQLWVETALTWQGQTLTLSTDV
jgi:phage gp46-like protein